MPNVFSSRWFRSASLIAAIAAGASAAQAGFVLSLDNLEQLPGGMQAVSVRATNTGGTTGTMLRAFALQLDVAPPLPPASQTANRAYFYASDTNANGVKDSADMQNLNNFNAFSFIRVGSVSNTQILTATPPTFAEPNAYASGVQSFSVSATGINDVPATGLGALFARVVIPSGAGVSISGDFGGETGGPSRASFILLATVPAPEPSSLLLLTASALLLRQRRQA